MPDNLKLLPPPEKKVAAKVLYNMGWSSRQIEQWIGVDNVTVTRYKDLPTPEELQQFETEFTSVIQSEKKRGIALGIKRLNELIPKERKMSELVRGLEYLEGNDKSPKTNIQINNLIKKEKDEFDI